MVISQICKKFNLEYVGNDVDINGLNLIGRFTSKDSVLSYVTKGAYSNKIKTDNSIKALIIPESLIDKYKDIMMEKKGCLIISNDSENSFYQIHDYLYNTHTFYNSIVTEPKISDTAIIHPTAGIEKNVIIEDDVNIGAFSVVKAGSIIKKGTHIGNHSIIGAEGFQVLRIDDIPTKISHCGGVLIDCNVSIGDHCTVCNTLFDGFTKIGTNTKIDNYCQIAHYVSIGNNVIITPGVVLVGGVTIEDDCYIGANATIMNKVIVHKNAIVGIGSVVMQNVKSGATVFGNPAKQISQNWEN